MSTRESRCDMAEAIAHQRLPASMAPTMAGSGEITAIANTRSQTEMIERGTARTEDGSPWRGQCEPLSRRWMLVFEAGILASTGCHTASTVEGC